MMSVTITMNDDGTYTVKGSDQESAQEDKMEGGALGEQQEMEQGETVDSLDAALDKVRELLGGGEEQTMQASFEKAAGKPEMMQKPKAAFI